jgi:hypothetical protein
VNSFGIKPVNRKRHLCCPFCGGRSCRCGARVGRFGLESGDERTALCDVSPPLRLIERLRAHATRDN